jgi:hypothetical protein
MLRNAFLADPQPGFALNGVTQPMGRLEVLSVASAACADRDNVVYGWTQIVSIAKLAAAKRTDPALGNRELVDKPATNPCLALHSASYLVDLFAHDPGAAVHLVNPLIIDCSPAVTHRSSVGRLRDAS